MADLAPLLDTLTGLFSLVVKSFSTPSFFVILAIFLIMVGYDILNRGWEKSITGKFYKGSITSLGILLVNSLVAPITYFGIIYLDSLYGTLGIPHLPSEIWSGVPLLVIALIAIVCTDFADYVNHRIMHQRWLWPIHAIHHSDEEVNALTTYRVHALEVLFMKGSYIVLLTWMGVPAEAGTVGAVLLAGHNAYVHANLDWDHGPFKLLIASPKFHRWHHANDKRAFGKNLANVMPIYDYMFGTYYEPEHCNVPMGADGVPHSDLIGLILFPFKAWHTMIKRTVKKFAPSQNNAPQTEAK